MSVLPNRVPFLRLIIHKVRRLLWKILSEISPQNLVDEQIMSYRDRLTLLESHINWRLYGIPTKIHNIKLEQAQLFSGSGEVEWALEKFRKNLKIFSPPVLENIPDVESVFMFPGDENLELTYFKTIFSKSPRITVIEDKSDLFRSGEHQNIKEQKNLQVLIVNAAEAAARLATSEFDFVWLSSVVERLTPLQSQILLKRASSALIPNGICAGYFEEYSLTNAGMYWADVRRVRPLTSEFIHLLAKNAGFRIVKIYQDSTVSSRYIYNLTTA